MKGIASILCLLPLLILSDILKLSNERLVPNQLKLKHRFVFAEGRGNNIELQCMTISQSYDSWCNVLLHSAYCTYVLRYRYQLEAIWFRDQRSRSRGSSADWTIGCRIFRWCREIVQSDQWDRTMVPSWDIQTNFIQFNSELSRCIAAVCSN